MNEMATKLKSSGNVGIMTTLLKYVAFAEKKMTVNYWLLDSESTKKTESSITPKRYYYYLRSIPRVTINHAKQTTTLPSFYHPPMSPVLFV